MSTALTQSMMEIEMTKETEEVHTSVKEAMTKYECDNPMCRMMFTESGRRIPGGSRRFPKGCPIYTACKSGTYKDGTREVNHGGCCICVYCKDTCAMCGHLAGCLGCLAKFNGSRGDAPPMEWDKHGVLLPRVMEASDALYETEQKVLHAKQRLVELGDEERARVDEQQQTEARADTAEHKAECKALLKSKKKGQQLTLLREAREQARRSLEALKEVAPALNVDAAPSDEAADAMHVDDEGTTEKDLFGDSDDDDAEPSASTSPKVVRDNRQEKLDVAQDAFDALAAKVVQLEEDDDDDDSTNGDVDVDNGAGSSGAMVVVAPMEATPPEPTPNEVLAAAMSEQRNEQEKQRKEQEKPTSKSGKSPLQLKRNAESAARQRERKKKELKNLETENEALKEDSAEFRLQFADLADFIKDKYGKEARKEALAHVAAMMCTREGEATAPEPEESADITPSVDDPDEDAEEQPNNKKRKKAKKAKKSDGASA